MNDYSIVFEVDAKPDRVFKAISKELTQWWGKQNKAIDIDTTKFKVSWGEPWYAFKILEYHENSLMIWECIDANQKIAGLKNIEKEWVETKIHWMLTDLTHGGTEIKFKHVGLTPALICFDFCSSSWEHFLTESLVNYIENQRKD